MFYVLDLDDTLFLEREYVRSGFREVGRWLEKNFSISGFNDQAWDFFEKGCRRNIFDMVLAENKINKPGLVKTLVNVYRSHDPQISLLPDAEDFLRKQDRNNLGIITDGYSNSQWKKIKALELENLVSRIIVTGDWGVEFWKPHTRAFYEIMVDHDPFECLYIADNPKKDFKAPERLCWAPSIRIRRLGSLHHDLLTPATVIEIKSFNELPKKRD